MPWISYTCYRYFTSKETEAKIDAPAQSIHIKFYSDFTQDFEYPKQSF